MEKDNRRLRVFVKHFVNPLLRNFTRSARGPFGLLRHVGRRSGKTFETPIWVWRVNDGFVIVLTYGPRTDWLRNLQAAGQGKLLWHKHDYMLQKPVLIDRQTAWPALPLVIRQVLRLGGVRNFVRVSAQPVS